MMQQDELDHILNQIVDAAYMSLHPPFKKICYENYSKMSGCKIFNRFMHNKIKNERIWWRKSSEFWSLYGIFLSEDDSSPIWGEYWNDRDFILEQLWAQQVGLA